MLSNLNFSCAVVWETVAAEFIGFLFYIYTFGFILPFSIIVMSYLLIFRAIKLKVAMFHNSQPMSQEARAKERRLKMRNMSLVSSALSATSTGATSTGGEPETDAKHKIKLARKRDTKNTMMLVTMVG